MDKKYILFLKKSLGEICNNHNLTPSPNSGINTVLRSYCVLSIAQSNM